jgi:hypothetical protein
MLDELAKKFRNPWAFPVAIDLKYCVLSEGVPMKTGHGRTSNFRAIVFYLSPEMTCRTKVPWNSPSHGLHD